MRKALILPAAAALPLLAWLAADAQTPPAEGTRNMTDEPLLLFRSPGKAHLNIVYRRHDGNIGWIDSANIKG